MGEEEAVPWRGSKAAELKRNLSSWPPFEWLFFFVDIPLLLVLIYALPQDVKDAFFIFNTAGGFNLPPFLLSAYTHSEIYPHLAGNLVLYLAAMCAIFAFETSLRRFRIMAALSLLLVPVICSLLTFWLWQVLGGATLSQGFSGVVAAFLAYAFMAGVTWALRGGLELFDRKELFPGPAWRYYVACVLTAVIVALIVLLGLIEGQFMPAGNSVSNGIAHFGGFVTGLIGYAAIDLLAEKRRTFDQMLIIAIIIGIMYYALYLTGLVTAVKGL